MQALLPLAGVCAVLALVPAAGTAAVPRPIVTVVRQGGLCPAESPCRSVARITDTTITAAGRTSRRLKAGERRALLRAVRALDPAYLDAHPFRGTCPVAYDGAESVYRFRGFARPLASCTYDLRGVRAVQLAERLFRSLPRR